MSEENNVNFLDSDDSKFLNLEEPVINIDIEKKSEDTKEQTVKVEVQSEEVEEKIVEKEQLVNNTIELESEKNEDLELKTIKKDKIKDENFNLLYEDSIKDLAENTIVEGKIILITEDEIVVDIGSKSEGVIPKKEFTIYKPEKGDTIKVYINKLEDKKGNLQLSYIKAKNILSKNIVESAWEEQKAIKGTIIEKIKGGFKVDIGLNAFLPFSQSGLRKGSDENKLLNKVYEFLIIDYSKNNIVVSRRKLLEERASKQRQELLLKLKIDDVVTGTVSNILSFGAFIDLNGIEGLLHISNISWGHITNIEEVLKIGQKLQLKILSIDQENGKIGLGLKQLSMNPWDNIQKTYFPGKEVDAVITKLNKKNDRVTSVILEIEPGINAIVLASEFTWNKINSEVVKDFQIGNTLNIKVINVDTDKKLIFSSIKQMQVNPWHSIKTIFENQQSVATFIVSVENNRIKVKLKNGLEGIVFKNDISWEPVNDISELYQEGEEINCRILEFNETKKWIKLGIKQLSIDPWYEKAKKLEKQSLVECKVNKIASFGVFVDLPYALQGLIHISKLTEKNIKKPEEIVKLGDKINAKVSLIKYDKREISLSVIDYQKEKEKNELKSYMKEQGEVDTSLGSLLNLDKLL